MHFKFSWICLNCQEASHHPQSLLETCLTLLIKSSFSAISIVWPKRRAMTVIHSLWFDRTSRKKDKDERKGNTEHGNDAQENNACVPPNPNVC